MSESNLYCFQCNKSLINRSSFYTAKITYDLQETPIYFCKLTHFLIFMKVNNHPRCNYKLGKIKCKK
jgi:hypothetical protein